MLAHRQSNEPRVVPFFVHLFAVACAAIGISCAIIFGFGVHKAFAAEYYTSDTFTYQGTTYPATLVGSTVTFNSNPAAPNSYGMGASGYNIVWTSGTWYSIDGTFLGSYGKAAFWLSEASTVNNPWYVAWNSGKYTSPMDGNFFDANNGWGASSATSRTVTFGSQYTLGDMSQSTVLKLLYHQGFIRYVVDNSDWRTRYSIDEPSSDSLSGSTTVGWLTSLGSSTSYFGISSSFYDVQPSRVSFWYSPTGQSGTWEKLGTLTEPTASGSNRWQYTWSVQRSGYYAVWAYVGNASAPDYVYNSPEVTYDESENPSSGGSGSGGSGGSDMPSDAGDIIQQALDTLRSIYNGFLTFFNGLLGWLPSDLRAFFVSIVVVSLVVGLFRIIRGS